MSPLRHILKLSVVIVFGSAGVAGADPLPITGEFLVNTTIAGNQVLPKTCSGSSGHVVVWQGLGAGEDIFGQLYNDAGVPVGSQIQINATTGGQQVQPDVACRDDGSFVVVWKGPDIGMPVDRIYARRFTAAGSPILKPTPNGEIVVDAMASGPKSAPAVAYSSSGEFLAVWQAQDGSMDDGIWGRAFGANGLALTSETPINVTTMGNQQDPAAAFIKTPVEAFAVVWEGGVGADVFLQRVRRKGGNLLLEGSELVVNSGNTTGVQENPDVAVSAITPDQGNINRIAVVWQGPNEALDRIWYRLWDTNGASITNETVVDTDLLAGPQAEPSVSMPDEAPELEVQPIITWSQAEGGDRSTGVPVFIVGARRPRTLLSELWGAPPANPVFDISVLGTTTSNSDVAIQPDGDFVVAWQTTGQDTSGEGIYARIFDANWLASFLFLDGFESGNTSAWSSTTPLIE